MEASQGLRGRKSLTLRLQLEYIMLQYVAVVHRSLSGVQDNIKRTLQLGRCEDVIWNDSGVSGSLSIHWSMSLLICSPVYVTVCKVYPFADLFVSLSLSLFIYLSTEDLPIYRGTFYNLQIQHLWF